MKLKKRGFTLIELLVVIAIIGLLASIILASLNSARQKGRDARRLADMKEVQLALELYYDANAGYPAQVAGNAIPSTLSPTDISVIPADPTNSGSYVYKYFSGTSDGSSTCSTGPCGSYLLVAHTEAGSQLGRYVGSWAGDSTDCTGATSAPYDYCVHN